MPTKRQQIVILLVGFGLIPMLWLGVYLQATILDPWFASEEEIDSLQCELNRQSVQLDAMEQSLKQMERSIGKLQVRDEVVHPNTMQPVSNAVQNHLWRERLRNWGQ